MNLRILAALLGAACALYSQAGGSQAEEIKNLVVVVRSTFSDGADTGAGILFGSQPGHLLILTANHVVRRSGEAARAVDVEFRWLSGERVKARWSGVADAGLDLAVLSVTAAAPPNLLHFDRLGNAAALNRGDPVFSVGHPNGKLWETNVRPDAMSRKDDFHLFFESGFAAPGNSGGALVNGEWELVGMLKSAQPPRVEAIAIDRIVGWLVDNGFDVALRKPGAPATLAELEAGIKKDVDYACAYAASFARNPDVKFEDVVAQLTGPFAQVEGDVRFRNIRSPLIGDLYRCLGGGYLLDKRLEMRDKLRTGIPLLKRSLQYSPAPLLASNVAFLETFQKNSGGDIKEYLTNLFEILQGVKDPGAAKAVDLLTGAAQSPEFAAKDWLLNQATSPSIMAALVSLRDQLNQSRNANLTLDIQSRSLPGGLVEVTATLGQLTMRWTVDHAKKEFTPMDDYSRKLMEVIAQNQR